MIEEELRQYVAAVRLLERSRSKCKKEYALRRQTDDPQGNAGEE